MNVLIIPEDFRKDQYILKPLFYRLFRRLGSRYVHVAVCHNPLLGGVGEALKPERIAEIVHDNRSMTDLFILCVDRDGVAGRRQRLDDIAAEVQDRFGDGVHFFAVNAWEELETWVLAGLDLPSQWRWQDVRAEINVKERYFEPLAAQRGLSNAPDGGRKQLGDEAARNVPAIRRKCPEDFDELALRIAAAASLA